jgi:predicted permease
VLLFTGVLSILAMMIFGPLPAFRASRVDVVQTLKVAGRGVVHGGQRLASIAIALEIGMTFVLLIGAGLLTMSALRMGSESLGFDPNGLLATRVTLPAFRYTTASQRIAFYDKLLGRLEQLPGTTAVALTSKVPPEAGGNQTLEIQGRPVVNDGEAHDIGADAVSSGFFDLLNIPLRSGRVFDARDLQYSQPVAIVNEALVREYFPNTDPIGQQIRIPGGPMPFLTVVGIVGNLKHTELMNEMRWVETPILYRPLAQEARPSIQIALRAFGDPASLALEIRNEIAELDPEMPVVEVETLTSRLSKTLAYAHFRAIVLVSFALTALFLSTAGLHGVLSQFIGQRTTEFGVRRAVGADTYDLLLLVAWQGGVPVVAGLALGILLSFALGRALAGMLYGIRSADPEVLIGVSLAFSVTAAIAILLPARRATHVDPMVALRNE